MALTIAQVKHTSSLGKLRVMQNKKAPGGRLLHRKLPVHIRANQDAHHPDTVFCRTISGLVFLQECLDLQFTKIGQSLPQLLVLPIPPGQIF